MPSVVNLSVKDPQKAAEYYESVLALTPTAISAQGATLAGDHVQLVLTKGVGPGPEQATLNVTSGMLARILDVAMHAKCPVTVDSAEQVSFKDRNGQRWTLRCRLT